MRRAMNQQDNERMIRAAYLETPTPSTIASKLPRYLDGTLEEYEK